MKLNYEKLKAYTGIEEANEEDLVYYIQEILQYLYTHNKNYTNTQYHKIEILKEIFECIEKQ